MKDVLIGFEFTLSYCTWICPMHRKVFCFYRAYRWVDKKIYSVEYKDDIRWMDFKDQVSQQHLINLISCVSFYLPKSIEWTRLIIDVIIQNGVRNDGTTACAVTPLTAELPPPFERKWFILPSKKTKKKMVHISLVNPTYHGLI